MSINIKHFFDNQTSTFSYIITDIETKKVAIIDPVLNYDQYSGKTSTKSADELITYIKDNHLELEWILETHIHADHLTSSYYIKNKLGGKTGISARIKEVLSLWVPIFNTSHNTPLNASKFDKLFEDNEVFKLGNTTFKVLQTPGHTPSCLSYVIEDAAFVGDLIFMPDIGTARTDFPGGSAGTLYDSIHRIFNLGSNIKIYTCHDYPPEHRGIECLSTVREQKEKNILINEKVSRNKFIEQRNKRDDGKPVPKLLFPSIQVNLRAGEFGEPENNGKSYIKIPLDAI